MNTALTDEGPFQPQPARVVDAAVALILDSIDADPTTPRVSSPPTPCILMTKRLANTVYAGYWELPGGKVEPGEASIDAAVREVREETGAHVLPLAALDPVVHIYDHATVRLHPFICRIEESSPAPRAIQVAEIKWCPIDELPWAEFLPANVRLITALVRWLNDSSRQWLDRPTRS